jgi:sugar phosphate permease
MLSVVYALNRLVGAGAWNAMVKITASWTPPRWIATAMAALSISFVLGSILATLLAKALVEQGAGWRGVLSLPSIVLGVLVVVCAIWIRPGPIRQLPPVDEAPSSPTAQATAARPSRARLFVALLTRPRFLVVCLLSFTLTLMREAFSTWSVDYLVTLQTGATSVPAAALNSISFDAAGAVSILVMGLTYDRLPVRARRWVICGILMLLTLVLAQLTMVGKANPGLAVWLLGAVGLLSYGPYSLLAGVLAVECGGEELAGTSAGFIDGVGYLAAILAGQVLGGILDNGGYPTAFRFMAVLTFFAALTALALTPPRREPPAAAHA